MNKKNLIRFAIAAAGLLALPLTSQAQTKIYIDPGHGGSDPGAVNSTFGTEEADRVLYTGLELRDYFNADTADTGGGGSWSTRMSRTTDTFISLAGRVNDANSWGAARFMSIHQNAFNSSANGTETFSYQNGTNSANLRDWVQSEAIQAWGLVNRGSKTANFYVLRNTSMPAILTEMGFVDSPTDHPYCVSNFWCSVYALGMLYGAQQHYGISEYEPGASVPDIIVDNTDSGYNDSSNWFTGTYASGYYGSNYGGRLTAFTSDAATWSANVTTGGSYEVFTRWTAGSTRASAAPYIVYHTGGSTVVYADQTTNNGTWVSLGTYNLATGTSTRVALSCWTSSGTYVISDAIKLVKQ